MLADFTKKVMSHKGQQTDDFLFNISAPKLSEYYLHSEDQKIREYIFVAGGAIVGAAIAYWFHLRNFLHKNCIL